MYYNILINKVEFVNFSIIYVELKYYASNYNNE